MSIVTYMRVSTDDQSLALQHNALKKYAASKVFTDTASGKNFDRPGLQQCLEYLREGDTLVVWKLDRIGRSLKGLIELVEDLQKRGIDLVIDTQNIDTRTAVGKLMFQIVGAFSEFERSIITERSKAGVDAAKKRGVVCNRPKKLYPRQEKELIEDIASNNYRPRELQHKYDISNALYYRYAKKVKQSLLASKDNPDDTASLNTDNSPVSSHQQ